MARKRQEGSGKFGTDLLSIAVSLEPLAVGAVVSEPNAVRESRPALDSEAEPFELLTETPLGCSTRCHGVGKGDFQLFDRDELIFGASLNVPEDRDPIRAPETLPDLQAVFLYDLPMLPEDRAQVEVCGVE